MNIQWLSVILGLVFGAFFGPIVLAKFSGKTGATATSQGGGY